MKALLLAAAVASASPRPMYWCSGNCTTPDPPFSVPADSTDNLSRAMRVCLSRGGWFDKATGKMVSGPGRGSFFQDAKLFVWGYPTEWRDCFTVEAKWSASWSNRYTTNIAAATAREQEYMRLVTREAQK